MFDTPKFSHCLRKPIPEIFDTARYLDAAVSAHTAGNRGLATELIRLSDLPVMREYVESLWGAKSAYVHVREVGEARPYLLDAERVGVRMPGVRSKRKLIDRDGYHCRFCGIPVISAEVRNRMKAVYPEVLPWGDKNAMQHAAFQVMWLQYDHLLPHARGGTSDLDNMVIACAPCNYSRMNWTLEEVGLLDPRGTAPVVSLWDGLERFKASVI